MRITAADNKKIKDLRKLAASSKARRENQLCFCEGDTLFEDALSYGVEIDHVFFREGHEKELPVGIDYDSLENRLFDGLSQVESPQNVIFTAKMPEEKEPPQGSVLLLDSLQDPGNLGTIIRTAVAFGIPVFMGEGCVDPFSPKVVRSAMGALFRVHLRRGDIFREIERLQEEESRVLAATLTARSMLLGKENLLRTSVIIGNEGKGVSSAVTEKADGEIIIPMTPDCESLNAAMAAGIMMWEMKKNR